MSECAITKPDGFTALVIRRELDESVVIGEPENPRAIVQVIRIGRTSVRLRVLAPEDVPIYRGEESVELEAEGR